MPQYLLGATLQLIAADPDAALEIGQHALRGLQGCEGLQQIHCDREATLFSPAAFEQMTGQLAMPTDEPS